MSRLFTGKDKPDILTVNFILLPHFSLLAFTAAADALTTANLVNGEQLFRFRSSALVPGGTISDLGIRVPADEIITPASRQQDEVVLVCGGYRSELAEQPQLSQWLRESDQHGNLMGGLWNGILALAHAGLMKGYACALHPDNHAYAVAHHPDMQLRAQNMVLDRNRLSAAGPNSAFELMLLLVRRHDSADTVHAIRQILRADSALGDAHNGSCGNPTPGMHVDSVGNTSAAPLKGRHDLQASQDSLPDTLLCALQLMRSNLDSPVNKEELAQHINMSIRAMERLFQRYLNTSPAKCYLQLRLQRAHELLSQSDLSVGEIGDACGFISAAHFSRSFSRRYGQAPSDVRRAVTALLDI